MTTSTTPIRSALNRAELRFVAFFLLSGVAIGQTAPETEPATPAPSTPPTAPAPPATVPAPAANTPAKEETLKMNAFGVQAKPTDTYTSSNSNSITGFNTELDRLPITAEIFDQTFVQDTASTSIEQMVETYSAGAGYDSGDPAASAGSKQPGDRNGGTTIQLHGLGAALMQRDGFMPVGSFVNPGSSGVGFSSNFDVERVEVINGPQSVLYEVSGGGGVINTVSKQARLGQPAFGSAQFQVDQYGNRLGQFDYGAGTEKVAVRVAILDQTVGGRRVDVGGPVQGYYAQLAFKLFSTTIVRVVGEQTAYSRINSTTETFTAASTTNDARNGDYLHFLLATGQMASARSGSSGAGPIDGLQLNWGNIDSLAGWWASEETVNAYGSISAETQWTNWLSTRLTLSYDNYAADLASNTLTFYPPSNTGNPLGVWAMGMTGAYPNSDIEEPDQTKGLQFSALATNSLLGGRVRSQTYFGADFVRTDAAQIPYDYFQADSGFHVIVTPANVASITNGRTVVPKTYWSVAKGPIPYPLWGPRTPYLAYAGVNYVRQMISEVSPALLGPGDPTGTVAGGSNEHTLNKGSDQGVFALNYSQWLDGKLDTLVGVRVSSSWEETLQQSAPVYFLSRSTKLNFDLGADYAVRSWLRPYFSVTDSFNPPAVQATDPYGKAPEATVSLGEEVGLKMHNEAETLSGSIGFFHINSKNQQYQVSSTLTSDINPTGLNGRFGSPSNWIDIDRYSEGFQAIVTGAPVENLRLNLSAAVTDGRVGSTTSYGQLYNDQFHENSAGQVTFADGTIVYVPAAFNSKSPTTTSTTAGAIPLTVTAMSTSGNAYYANPTAITGQINSGANVATVLRTVDPVHGAILTGAVGLPISDLQIKPGFTPPGTIVTSRSGDVTVGYPEFSLSLTDVYTLASGWARGLRIGETVALGWRNRSYYYYPDGVAPGAPRTLFEFPDLFRVDFILGYRRKISRFGWSTQLNVTNMFNRYHIVITPNASVGFAGTDNATFDLQPRAYVWTNTLSF